MIGAGLVLLVIDMLRPKRALAPRNHWNAGTLEWLTEMPGKPWGVRSIPQVNSRYPLWDQSDSHRTRGSRRVLPRGCRRRRARDVITSVVDAEPIQCMRLPGPSFLPMIAADFTGLAFIVATFHFYRLAVAFMALQLAVLSRVGIVFIAAPLVFVRSCL